MKEKFVKRLWNRVIENLYKRSMGDGVLWQYLAGSTQGGQLNGRVVNVQNNLDLNTDWISACFNVIAHNVATAQPIIEKIVGDNRIEAPENHPAYELFDRVNQRDTYYDLMYLTQYSKELFGWMFWWLRMDLNAKIPYEIVPIVPAMGRMEIVLGDDGNVKKYILWSGAGRQEFNPMEILHIKNLDIADTVYGIGTLNKILRLANMDRQQKDHNLFVFNNQATPSGMISIPGNPMTTPIYNDYMTKLQAKMSGKGNAGKVNVLDGGATWVQMGMSPEQLQYVNTLELTRDQISNIIGVPRAVLGVTGATTRADAETQKYFFLANTIETRLTQIGYTLTQDFIQRFWPIPGAKVRLRFASVVPNDEMAESQLDEIKLRTGRVTVNDLLEKDGKPTVPDGDKHYISAGLIDISESNNLGFQDLLNPQKGITQKETS